jgi:hypothetical protein
MVEVAIALGVIAIALVAIIGVLPTGLQVQKENREETLLNQDGMVLLEAIRNGRDVLDRQRPITSRGTDFPNGLQYLTNHVLAVTVANTADGAMLYVNPYLTAPPGDPPMGRLTTLLPFGRLVQPDQTRYDLTNGLHMVGLLGRPRVELRNGTAVTNYVAALVRSMSGVPTAQASIGRDLAFTYVVESEVTPLGTYPSQWLDYTEAGLTPEQVLVRSNRFMRALNQGANFAELRLSLQGPALEIRRDGEARWRVMSPPMLMRTILSGSAFSFQVNNDPTFVVSYRVPDGYRRLTP